MPRAAPHRPNWWGTLLYLPALYGIGWLVSRPLAPVFPGWRPDQVDLAGLGVSLALFLLCLPWRVRRAWGSRRPWRELGVAVPLAEGLRTLGNGIGAGALLLILLTAALLASGQAVWRGTLDVGTAWNAMALAVGVGFAEELLFRGWLWGELERMLPRRPALLSQAACFALIHPWYRLPGFEAVAMLGGLVLLGLSLALQRRADGGSLWGAVGLHGMLVGGWFALQAGILDLSAGASAWWVGPGQAPNPIGGLIGWGGLTLLLWRRRPCW